MQGEGIETAMKKAGCRMPAVAGNNMLGQLPYFCIITLSALRPAAG
jgi:hypothetical protein